MRIVIDDNILDKYNLTFKEFLYLLLLDNDFSEEDIEELNSKGFLFNGSFTTSTSQELGNILNEMNEEPFSENKILALAEKLMKIFPQGRKEGTAYYWKCNKKEVKDKLKKFYVYFGNQYTEEQILDATRRYVESFNGNYTYMRLLKYFIWKNDMKRTPEGLSVEQVSDLASYIENAGQEDSNSNDWTATLV